MSRLIAVILLTTTITVGVCHTASAQDSVQVVILSKRVGPEINALQREYFHLFPIFEGFQSARVLKKPDDTFEVRAYCLQKDGRLVVNVVPYPLATLLQIAEKINHFEDLESANYEMGSDPAKLQVIRPNSLVPEEISHTVTEQMKSISAKMAPLPGLRRDPPIDLQAYPRLRVGAGLSTYSPGADEVNSMLGRIEQAGRDQGYPVGSQKVDLGLSMFYWFTLGVDVTHDISIELEAGKSSERDVDVRTASLVAVYYFDPLSFAFLRPFAGIGITNFNLDARQEYVYSARKPTDTAGGYWEFYSVIFRGKHNEAAPTITAGLETKPPKGSFGIALRVGVKYVNCPNMSVATEGGYFSALDMKRFSFGANLFLYF